MKSRICFLLYSNELDLKACLHGRFLAHLSPDTVTADDARQQPDTRNDVAEVVG